MEQMESIPCDFHSYIIVLFRLKMREKMPYNFQAHKKKEKKYHLNVNKLKRLNIPVII